MKKTIIFTLAVLLALALGACGSGAGENTAAENTAAGDAGENGSAAAESEESGAAGDLAYLLEKDTFVIGITEYEPMNYYDADGKLVGFDTEFAEAACAKLGLTPEFVEINWDTKEIELAAKNLDCIWNGLTVKEERRKNMAFTDSYLQNEQVVVARAADAGKYADAASLAGTRVVAEAESAGEDAVKSDIGGADYIAVASQAGALLELKAGTADVAVIDYTMARAMTGPGTDYEDLAILEGIDLTDEEYAIGFRLESTAVAAFNEIIAELRSDGTLAGLAEKYGIADLLIE
jgi:polar amino acid transport system substrate-binding protein